MRTNILAAACLLSAIHLSAAQAPPVDAERLLTSRFGFSADELAQARSGQAVAKLLPANDATDIGVYGAVRIAGKADRLVAWLNDIANFRTAAQLGTARRLSSPPAIADFADLSLDPADLDALRACRPGKCDLRLGDRAIQRVQAGVDWGAADAASKANALVRQMLVEHAQAYLKGGDASLGTVHDEKAPRQAADDFHQVLWQSKALYDVVPALATYLEGFPSATLPQSEQFLYWAKGGAGSEASVTLHQMVVYRAGSGQVFVADKQLYASRYVDAALLVVSLSPDPNGTAFYALVGARARSRALTGVGARVLRGTVERATRDTAKMYLDWIRESLAR